jgi:hypothetical protein
MSGQNCAFSPGAREFGHDSVKGLPEARKAHELRSDVGQDLADLAQEIEAAAAGLRVPEAAEHPRSAECAIQSTSTGFVRADQRMPSANGEMTRLQTAIWLVVVCP